MMLQTVSKCGQGECRWLAFGSGNYMDTRKYWVQLRMFLVSCGYVFIYTAPHVVQLLQRRGHRRGKRFENTTQIQ